MTRSYDFLKTLMRKYSTALVKGVKLTLKRIREETPPLRSSDSSGIHITVSVGMSRTRDFVLFYNVTSLDLIYS